MPTFGAGTLIQASYFVAAALFIFGLKRMSSPVTARRGIVWAGVGMLVATLITFLSPGMQQLRADDGCDRDRRHRGVVQRASASR